MMIARNSNFPRRLNVENFTSCHQLYTRSWGASISFAYMSFLYCSSSPSFLVPSREKMYLTTASTVRIISFGKKFDTTLRKAAPVTSSIPYVVKAERQNGTLLH